MSARWLCRFCGEDYQPRSNVQRYCSELCHKAYRREQARKNRETVTCACGALYSRQIKSVRQPVKCASCRSLAAHISAGDDGLFFDAPRWFISCRDRTRVAYYRAVMEAELRRPLRSDEHVHHINGDPSDDRIENLQLVDSAEHGRIHATELVERRARQTYEERRTAALKAWDTKRRKAAA